MPQTPTDTKFVSITDFRPGIVEPSAGIFPSMQSLALTSGGVTKTVRSSQGLSQPDDPGHADYANTWGCTSTLDGGLVGFPGFTCIGLPFCSNLTNGVTNTP